MGEERRRLPLLARLFLVLGGGTNRERALRDLEDVWDRVASVGGRASARRACVREAFFIMAWSGIDRVRRWREEREDGLAEPGIRRSHMLADTVRDLRFAIRSLVRRPGFTAISVGVLALGVGATTTIFTLVNRLFLEPPAHVGRPSELIRLFRASGTFRSGSMDYADYLDYRAAAASDVDLAASSSGGAVVTARIGPATVQVNVAMVSENWFDVLGVRAAAGRFFVAEENRTRGADPVAIVSFAFWRDALGGAADAVGRDLVVNGNRFTVVGVTPRGFRGFEQAPQAVDVYIPLLMLTSVSPRSDNAWYERVPDMRENWINVIGRLRGAGSVERVQSMVSSIAERLHPAEEGHDAENVYVAADYRWSPGRRRSLWSLTWMMMGAVTVLLIVAAANVAILLLARASTRGREIGIRAAIGAGRVRLLRQLMAESLLLGLGGAVLGVALAVGASGLAASLLPVQLDPAPGPDVTVLLFALGVSLVTSVLVGAVPALRATRSDVVGLIQGRSRHAGGTRLRDGLIVFQTALSLVLVAGAALFARSLASARNVDLGFDTHNALLIRVELDARGYDIERSRAFIGQALDRIATLPGVTASTVSRMVPFRGDWSAELKPWAGAPFTSSSPVVVGLNAVGAGYFDAMQIPIVRGRPIDDGDSGASSPVIVVNETFARTVFPGVDVLGRTVPLRGPDQPALLIVGVAKDAKYYEFNEEPQVQVYGAILQQPVRSFSFIVKTARPPVALMRPVEDVLRSLDADLAFPSVETLESIHDGQLAAWRTSANVVGVTGLIALLLASAGLYGVMAFRVTERTREIGVRMAFGATRRQVAGAVLKRGLLLAATGSVVGLAGAFGLSRLLRSLLFGVAPHDLFSFLIAPVVLLVMACVAVLVPARRAMAVDPMRAIRSD
jgi:putative ABC transport system permease protein